MIYLLSATARRAVEHAPAQLPPGWREVSHAEYMAAWRAADAAAGVGARGGRGRAGALVCAAGCKGSGAMKGVAIMAYDQFYGVDDAYLLDHLLEYPTDEEIAADIGLTVEEMAALEA